MAYHDLNERIKNLKAQAEAKGSKGKGSSTGFALLFTELVAGVAISSFLGYLLDKYFGTSPWCFVILNVLGVIAVLRSGYGSLTKDNTRSDKIN